MIKVTGTSNVVIHREPGCFLRCLGMMLARAFQSLFVLETNGRPVKYLTPFHPSLRPRFPTFAQVEFEKFPRKFYCTTKLLSPPPMISLVDIYPRLSLSLSISISRRFSKNSTREKNPPLFKVLAGAEMLSVEEGKAFIRPDNIAC